MAMNSRKDFITSFRDWNESLVFEVDGVRDVSVSSKESVPV